MYLHDRALAGDFGYDNKPFLLVNEAGSPMRIGDPIETFRGEKGSLESVRPPHKCGSQGHITMRTNDGHDCEFYPSVCGLKFMEVTPQMRNARKAITENSENEIMNVLRDMTVMAENAIRNVRTGRGLSLRDGIGQWESVVRDARKILNSK